MGPTAATAAAASASPTPLSTTPLPISETGGSSTALLDESSSSSAGGRVSLDSVDSGATDGALSSLSSSSSSSVAVAGAGAGEAEGIMADAAAIAQVLGLGPEEWTAAPGVMLVVNTNDLVRERESRLVVAYVCFVCG